MCAGVGRYLRSVMNEDIYIYIYRQTDIIRDSDNATQTNQGKMGQKWSPRRQHADQDARVRRHASFRYRLLKRRWAHLAAVKYR